MKILKYYILTIHLISCVFSNLYTQKEAVFIIGTGRSGTSCAAFLLKTLGLEMGNDFVPANIWNPKGCFEDRNTSKLSWDILQEMNYNFLTVKYINWKKHPKREEYKKRIYKHIENNFGKYEQFGIKNPQISFLLPLYIEVCRELGYHVKLITILRNTEEIAHSFAKNSQYKPEFYRTLVCDCYRAILEYGNGCDQITLDYEDILHDLPNVVEKINKFLPSLKTYNEVKDILNSFFDPKMQHHNFS